MSATPGLLTLQQKVLLEHLRHCRGAPLPMARLIVALYGGRADGGPENAAKVVTVQIARLRQWLAPHGVAILTIGQGRWSEGYMLDPGHLDKLEAVLATLQERSIEAARMHGLSAQSVRAALDAEGVKEFGGWSKDKETGRQMISEAPFVYPLINAVKELSAKCAALEARLAA